MLPHCHGLLTDESQLSILLVVVVRITALLWQMKICCKTGLYTTGFIGSASFHSSSVNSCWCYVFGTDFSTDSCDTSSCNTDSKHLLFNEKGQVNNTVDVYSPFSNSSGLLCFLWWMKSIFAVMFRSFSKCEMQSCCQQRQLSTLFKTCVSIRPSDQVTRRQI